MKIRILIFLLLAVQVSRANMASPVWEGTITGAAFTSRNITILSENIQIKIDKDYKTARFIVEYTIQSFRSGKQIPLLFYAQNYKDSFFVWTDNQRIPVQNIRGKYTRVDDSPFSAFSASFEKNNQPGQPDEVSIRWSNNAAFVYRLSDLIYFETNIAKGTHTIRVEYTANVETNTSGWIKEYSFFYSLTPAKFWKSFGTLHISVEQEGTVRQLATNIGQPAEKTFGAKNSWTFNKLPAEYLEFSYTPKANNLAKTLITIQPLGLSIIAAIILFALHLFFALQYRTHFINSKYSPVVIVGSLLIPFLILLSYLYSYEVIDNAIGKEAGRHHGYVFLVFILYPVLLPVYWTIVWLLDKQQKQRLRKT